jgi:hypothetical protein
MENIVKSFFFFNLLLFFLCIRCALCAFVGRKRILEAYVVPICIHTFSLFFVCIALEEVSFFIVRKKKGQNILYILHAFDMNGKFIFNCNEYIMYRKKKYKTSFIIFFIEYYFIYYEKKKVKAFIGFG